MIEVSLLDVVNQTLVQSAEDASVG